MQFAGKTLLAPQELAVQKLTQLLDSGEQRIVFVSPTGTGKTLMMGAAIHDRVGKGERVHLQTYRKLLLSQLAKNMDDFGIDYGVRASGMEHLADYTKKVQLAMTQTEMSRKKRMVLDRIVPDAMFLDEAHNQLGGESGKDLMELIDSGMALVNVTATPVNITKNHGTVLVEAGKNSEFRKLGLLLPCHVFGPDEPELALKLKPEKTGEFKQGDVVKAIMTPKIFGRVIEHYNRLNPKRRPAILFGPGVPESMWFADQFYRNGIRSAHIDSDNVWVDGKVYKKTQSLVDSLRWESESGKIKVVCNRFVLREGLDWPHLYHCILATIFGSLSGYLQSVGRLLRAYPGMEMVILQDHGGNWHRHGSPNADRTWVLGWDDRRYVQERIDSFREKKTKEPIVCPYCGAVREFGDFCITCKKETPRKGRYVIQQDGNLKYITGSVYKKRKVKVQSDTEKKWLSCYYRCRAKNKTFRQAYTLFRHENGYYPPTDLPMMPKEKTSWYSKVNEIPYSELHSSNSGENRKDQRLFT